MFVLSMKTTRLRLTVAAVVLFLLVAVMLLSRQNTTTVSVGGDDAKRVAYLQAQGHEVHPQWTEVREVVIPTADAIPAAYRGKRVKCFTYATVAGECLCLYEYDGTIIGVEKQGNHDGTIG